MVLYVFHDSLTSFYPSVHAGKINALVLGSFLSELWGMSACLVGLVKSLVHVFFFSPLTFLRGARKRYSGEGLARVRKKIKFVSSNF